MVDQVYTAIHVDDDPGMTSLVEEFLESDRLEPEVRVETTNDPEEALEIYEQDPEAYDVIISDGDMGSMTGAELLESIREVDEVVPFFLYTGKERDETEVDNFAGGCLVTYFQKSPDLKSYEEMAEWIADCAEDY